MTSRTALDRIREAELDAARRIEDARRTAGERLAEAHGAARRIVDDARADGVAIANARYEEAIARAERQARQENEEPDRVIAEIRAAVEPELDDLAGTLVELILAPPEERGV